GTSLDGWVQQSPSGPVVDWVALEHRGTSGGASPGWFADRRFEHAEPVARRLLVVAHEQERRGEGGNVPGLAAERLDARELVVSFRRRLDEHELALFGDHEEQIVDEQELT